jgi:hypothetical protein
LRIATWNVRWGGIRVMPLAVPRARIVATLCVSLLWGCAAPQRQGPAMLHDEFEAQELDHAIWWPRTIAAGRYRIDASTSRAGARSLAIDAEPADRDPNDPSVQRNELWLREPLWDTADADTWYGFSFRISGDIPATGGVRWVIGQWKEENSRFSPFLAQRFDNGIFRITVQDNNCMVRIAQAPTGPGQQMMGPPVGMIMTAGQSMAAMELARTMMGPCTSNVRVVPGETMGMLPSPTEGWVDMVYRVRRGRDGQGLVAVWANGQSVVQASGSIGNDGTGPRSYFKIGMYRDVTHGAATLHFDNFRRGRSRAEVDPAIWNSAAR